MRRRIFSVAAFICWLAGCSSGSGTDIPDPVDPVDPVPMPPTAPTGRATYDGQISLGFDSSATTEVVLLGDLALAVDFDAAAVQVTGEATDFRVAGNGTLDGSLFFTRGVIDPTAVDGEPDFDGALSGALSGGGTSYVVFGTFDGMFRGTDEQAVTGDISGTIREGNSDFSLTGSYQAGR